jgi:glycosyltransferase involved in cell wall biosynthesis
MHICFFTENFNKGGLDTFLINLINFWPNPEDELTLLCNENHPGIEIILGKTNGKVDIKNYRRLFLSNLSRGYSSFWDGQFKPIKKVFGGVYRLLQYPILFPWYIFSLTVFFKKSHFDRMMVVNGGYPGSLLCRAAAIAWKISGKNTKCIFNIHSSASTTNKLSSPIENFIDRLLITSAQSFICVSKSSVTFLKRRNAFYNSNKVSYIYNGIADPAGIKSSKFQKSKTLLPPYILMLATLDKYKGHEFLLRSFQKIIQSVPTVELKIFGHGTNEQRKFILDKIFELQLSEKVFLGNFVPNPESYIYNASVMVVPSQDYEAFGLTIIEAMALQTPIVATDVGGIPEVLEGSDAGFICSKNDLDQFAKHISEILNDNVLAERLGVNGRNTFEKRFNAAMMANQYYLALQ